MKGKGGDRMVKMVDLPLVVAGSRNRMVTQSFNCYLQGFWSWAWESLALGGSPTLWTLQYNVIYVIELSTNIDKYRYPYT